MIQNHDSLWSQPHPLPLPANGSNDPDAPTCDGAGRAAPLRLGEKQLSADPPIAFSDEDYQWLMLL
jgi:hypothetical protein